MADAIQDLADIPKDFFKDGTAFLNRCTKRTSLLSKLPSHSLAPLTTHSLSPFAFPQLTKPPSPADRREFIKISQAVGMGFLIMGAIGYVIKLIHIPVNNILVGGA